MAGDYPDIKITILPDYHNDLGPATIRSYLPDVKAEAVLMLSDDMEVHPDCISILVNMMKKNYPDTDGIVAINQYNLRMPEPYAPAFIGNKFLKRFPNNNCLCPDYKFAFCDTELMEYAIQVKRYTICLEAKVIHHHPCLDSERKEMDKTHYISRQYLSQDRSTRQKRLDQGLTWGKGWELIR